MPERIKHKETGLYYCPARKITVRDDEMSFPIKTNLSKKGKIYHKANLKWIGYNFYSHLKVVRNDKNLVSFKEEDWEIEEIKTERKKDESIQD